MNKRFTDNEIRAYSKNRFEERALRHRLERLREEFLSYNDITAKRRSNIIQESRSIRRTSGGSPVRSLVSEEDWEEDGFYVRDRVRRPWAYSVMETTYNSIYREAELPPPKSRDRKRAKSAATVLMRNSSSSIDTNVARGEGRKCSSNTVVLPKSCMSASRIGSLPVGGSTKSNSSSSDNNLIPPLSASTTTVSSVRFMENGDTGTQKTDMKQSIKPGSDKTTLHMEITEINNSSDEGSVERASGVFKQDNAQTVRPYTKVISLPPAYTIDSKSYQEAEWERLRNRSKSRDTFSQTPGIVIIPSPDEKQNTRFVEKQGNMRNKKQGTANSEPDDYNVEQQTNEQDTKTGSEHESSDSKDANEKAQKVIKAKEKVTYRGRLIKNYIRPEDRYKLDPSVLNRRQKRMDKLAKESSTYLKRVNHENIRVELEFPRSARKRLLTKLVAENNSGRRKTLPNTEGPFIKKKVERFMVSISNYIEQQRFQRANTVM